MAMQKQRGKQKPRDTTVALRDDKAGQEPVLNPFFEDVHIHYRREKLKTNNEDSIHLVLAQTNPASCFQRNVIQRKTAEVAYRIAASMNVSFQRYNDEIRPAIETIAAKTGMNFEEYIDNKQEDEWKGMLRELLEPFDVSSKLQSLSVIRWYGLKKYKFVRTERYNNFFGVIGLPFGNRTNLLVHRQIVQSPIEDSILGAFIKQYEKGYTAYRGIRISHFSWRSLKQSGVLASDGVEDNPTFTMSEPTRWLPFVNSYDIPKSIVLGVNREDEGLRHMLELGQTFPVGAVVSFHVTKDIPVAYLDAGEQVIRGPIKIEKKVDVILSNGNTIEGVSPMELPEPAPYGASFKGLAEWRQNVANWQQGHGKISVWEEDSSSPEGLKG